MSGSAPEEPRCGIAREKIKSLRVQGRDRSQFFYPLDKLRAYLTRDHTIWILNCPCRKCKTLCHAFTTCTSRTQFIDRIVGPPNNSAASRDPSKTAIALFSLLIYIEYPLLILGFAMRNCYDFHLATRSTTTFSSDHLRDYCHEFIAKEGNDQFEQFSADFATALPRFAIPRMESGAYSIYTRDTILPFVNEAPVGIRDADGNVRQEGAYGRVYSFEIYDEYRDFPVSFSILEAMERADSYQHAVDITKYARKELLRNSEFAFHLETTNLNVAETHNDPHIVRMLKAYKHGDTFNIIFPLAKTNLDRILRDRELGFDESTQGPIEACSAWGQVLGVAEALEKIGGPTGSTFIFGPRTQQQFRGVHFDLKPANILIDDDDNWIVSDFGQAVFRDAMDSSSRVPPIGGTDAYAPPEIDGRDEEFTRRYDIWSLGCIILEVTAFVVWGHDGLVGSAEYQGLDQVRCTQPARGHRIDSRFFCEAGPNEYKVKEGITNFMQELTTADRLRENSKSQTFIDRIIDLIGKMLAPNVDDRIDIGEVIRLLRFAIEDSNDTTQPLEMTAVEGERSILEPDLAFIPYVCPKPIVVDRLR